MRILCSLLLCTSACITVPNPAFELDTDDAGDAPTIPPTSGDSTDAPDPGPTGDTTAAPDDTSSGDGTTTTGLSEPGDDTTTGTTGPDDGSSGTTGDDTGPLATCWDQGAANWPLEGTPLQDQPQPALDPTLTPDGLGLLLLAGDPHRPFLAARETLADLFPPAVQASVWAEELTLDPRHARRTLAGEELLLTAQGDIYFSARMPVGDDEYTPPQILPGVNTDDLESHPTATADGTVLIVQRDDGPPVLPLLAHSWRFHQYTRDDPAPGDGFMDPADVTPHVDPLGLALCPALSPDGRHLLFASTDLAELSQDNADAAFSVFYTARAGVDQAWEPAQKLGGLSGGDGVPCPTSVTTDGCTLAYTRAPFGRATPPALFIAVRAP